MREVGTCPRHKSLSGSFNASSLPGEGVNTPSVTNTFSSSLGEWLKTQNKRKTRIWSTCRKYNIPVSRRYKTPPSQFKLYSKSFFYCTTHKVTLLLKFNFPQLNTLSCRPDLQLWIVFLVKNTKYVLEGKLLIYLSIFIIP